MTFRPRSVVFCANPYPFGLVQPSNLTLIQPHKKYFAAIRRTVMASSAPNHALHVLVVEDEAVIALHLQELLSSTGHTVIGPFSDPKQGLEAVRENSDAAKIGTAGAVPDRRDRPWNAHQGCCCRASGLSGKASQCQSTGPRHRTGTQGHLRRRPFRHARPWRS
jgi:hypothetical protein